MAESMFLVRKFVAGDKDFASVDRILNRVDMDLLQLDAPPDPQLLGGMTLGSMALGLPLVEEAAGDEDAGDED